MSAGTLAGCVSTQQKAARLRLNSARILVSQNMTRVTAPGHAVAVIRVALLAWHRQTAYVITVRNRGDRAVSDLPISIGYRSGHRRPVYLNAGTTSRYFDAHLPVIGARRTFTWVYTATRRLPPGAHPFASVGTAPAVPASITDPLPPIQAAVSAGAADGLLTVAVRNLSGVPQYQLPVYAVAEQNGRTVAAGTQTLPRLAGGAGQTMRLRLLGRVGHALVHVEAPPTIFQ